MNKVIYNETFKSEIFFFWNCEKEEVIEMIMLEHGIDISDKLIGNDGGSLSFHFEDGDMSILWTRENNVSILAHECIHVVTSLLKFRQIKTTYENQEIICYLVEWLLNKTIPLINKCEQKEIKDEV